MLLRTQLRPRLIEAHHRSRVIERHGPRKFVGEQPPHVEPDERREQRQIIDAEVLDLPRDVVGEKRAGLADLSAQCRALPVVIRGAEFHLPPNPFFNSILVSRRRGHAASLRGGGCCHMAADITKQRLTKIENH